MYDQMTEQFKESMKPVKDMMEINVKTMEALAEKQTSVFTEALEDSMAYTCLLYTSPSPRDRG